MKIILAGLKQKVKRFLALIQHSVQAALVNAIIRGKKCEGFIG
jgi:hypothetical protein